MEVVPAGVFGALAAKSVELVSSIIIAAVLLLLQHMEGDLVHAFRPIDIVHDTTTTVRW